MLFGKYYIQRFKRICGTYQKGRAKLSNELVQTICLVRAFCTPESFTHGLRSKCADLLNSYNRQKKVEEFYIRADKIVLHDLEKAFHFHIGDSQDLWSEEKMTT